MQARTLFRLETPYRQPFEIEGFEFGRSSAPLSVGIVGSIRGNEVQQTYIAARMVARLRAMEERGGIAENASILVIPSANSFSMNIGKRFWPLDSTDINRMFPGYDLGETTQRVAAGLFEAIQGCTYGMQLCSFYLPGDFMPHVRVTETGALDMQTALSLACEFGFPYALQKQPSPFDTTTLNYNWQVWDTYAFSLYSAQTDAIDEKSALFVEECILRFLHSVGAITEDVKSGFDTMVRRESDLVDVRTSRGGFFHQLAPTSAAVTEGDVLAEVLSTSDCSVLERLTAPATGRVFFNHATSLVNADTIAFRIIPN